jgi:hypothetical protein
VDVKEVRWDKVGTVRAGNYIFFCGKETKIINCSRFFGAPQQQYQQFRKYSLLVTGYHM